MKSKSNTVAPIHRWVAERVSRDIELAIQRVAAAEDVAHVAVMPDVHLSQDVCIGMVVGTNRLIYPAAVSGDIGCGMLAASFNSDADVLHDEQRAMAMLAALSDAVPTIRHRHHRTAPAIPDDLAQWPLSHPALATILQRDGVVEFATIGRGNHFIEFQADDDDRLWIMIHSGSRAMGPAIRDLHLRNARKTGQSLFSLDSSTNEGQAFLQDAGFARRYAAANRRAMLHAVAEEATALFGTRLDESSLMECDHNHVILETHFGQQLYVHRKGASRAGNEELGLIPGSMGTVSFHVMGRGEPDSLCSSSHGAGRALSRAEATARISVAELHRQMNAVWFDSRLADKLRDEAPSAYKDARRVMRAQRELTRITRRLRPLLCYKGV